MIIKCSNEWKNRVFSYIGSDYEKCLYIYADLVKYGMDSEHVTAWVNVIDDSIRAIIMQYHNGMHIYSSKFDYDKTELVNLIREMHPSMVLGIETIISDIAESFQGCSREYGYVKSMKKAVGNYNYKNIKNATLKDVTPLTEMLMADEEFTTSYTYDEMFGQISERILDGYGKTFYIYNEDEICAQLGISADMDKFMVISNVYTAKPHRGKRYASQLLHYANYISRGKKLYLFCYGDKISRYYDRIGFETVQCWGKLYIKV